MTRRDWLRWLGGLPCVGLLAKRGLTKGPDVSDELMLNNDGQPVRDNGVRVRGHDEDGEVFHPHECRWVPSRTYKRTFPARGYVQDCYLGYRQGDPAMFTGTENSSVIATLQGYAIIPLEEYYRLCDGDTGDG